VLDQLVKKMNSDVLDECILNHYNFYHEKLLKFPFIKFFDRISYNQNKFIDINGPFDPETYDHTGVPNRLTEEEEKAKERFFMKFNVNLLCIISMLDLLSNVMFIYDKT